MVGETLLVYVLCALVYTFACARSRLTSSYTSDCKRKGQQPDIAIVVAHILRNSLRVSMSNRQLNNKPCIKHADLSYDALM